MTGFTEKDVSEAVLLVKAGRTASTDVVYETETAARRAGRTLRDAVSSRGVRDVVCETYDLVGPRRRPNNGWSFSVFRTTPCVVTPEGVAIEEGDRLVAVATLVARDPAESLTAGEEGVYLGGRADGSRVVETTGRTAYPDREPPVGYEVRLEYRDDAAMLRAWKPLDLDECQHENKTVNDRDQFVCTDCGEELGR